MTKFMTKLRIFAVLAAALLVVSCSSNPDSKSEEDARQGKDSRDQDSLFSSKKKSTGRAALAVPPDLLASANEKVRENQGNNGAAAGAGYEVLPEVIGATIQSAEGKSWLEVDADAEVVWRKLTEFWAFEAIDLVTYQPEAGLMETDWFVKTGKAPAGTGVTSIAVGFFEAFTSRRTVRDKFTIRLERNGASGTNLYVTHRSREKVEKVYKNRNKTSEFEWVERSQDAEKIAQLLQTIVLLFDFEAEEANEPA